MEKRHKDILRSLVSQLRHILVGRPGEQGTEPGDLDRELERLGIERTGKITPIDVLADLNNGDGRAYRLAADQLRAVPDKESLRRSAVRREIVERAAYTWINRLLALRAMEVRGLIESTLRISDEYEGLSEQLYLLRLDHPEYATSADGGWWKVLTSACEQLTQALPGLFALDDPDAALHPTPSALLACLDLVGGKQPVLSNLRAEELDAALADPDAIGWAYQFYQEESKAAVDAKCKSGGKAASRSELAAKTQLFTEPYMVQWLLQNSLGRSYHEAYSESALPASWPYYIGPEQRAGQAASETVWYLPQLTLLDPCMGSGHFLRAAFDMFVAMYREQEPGLSAREIADRILSQHLFGIDLDPRAAQLAALTLYLRAWELVKTEGEAADMSIYVPAQMHLATTPTNLDRGALKRHIERHPEANVYAPLLEKIFAGLEQAEVLGSLLRSREYLDQAIGDLQKPHIVPIAYAQEEADLRQIVTQLANEHPQDLRQMLLDQVAASFHAEGQSRDDISMSLFGREAEKGVRLLQVLDQQYAVVATNPPYLGSAYMDVSLRKYIEKYYPSGKRDLYAAFILRGLELCKPNGRMAMVTMQSWMFLRSFANLRLAAKNGDEKAQIKGEFQGLLKETNIEGITHLGRYAFSEIGNAVVAPVLFIANKSALLSRHKIWACRLTAPRPSEIQATLLLKAVQQIEQKNIIFTPLQKDFLTLPDATMPYYLKDTLLSVFTNNPRLSSKASIKQGLATADDSRFLRYTWEVLSTTPRWATFTKGGGYCKWFGQNWYHVEWDLNGSRAKAFGKGRYQGINYYFSPGWSYSLVSGGSIGIRRFDVPGCIGHKGPGIYTDEQSFAAIAQSHALAFILRAVSPQLSFEINTMLQAPLPPHSSNILPTYVKLAEALKRLLISGFATERTFLGIPLMTEEQKIASLLHAVEGIVEHIVCQDYQLSKESIEAIIDETGTPAGWFPLIVGYDALPELPDEIGLPELPQELHTYLAAHERIVPDAQEMSRIKANLRALYEAGPGAKGVELEEVSGGNEDEGEEGEETVAGAHIPIPTETFLEELSVKMQLHPISVYWLLEELQATEMVRCLPEEKRLLEDRLSVLVLRLLGHRWPKQIEAFEPVPDWAEKSGIIPLVSGTGHRALAERVRERLQVEDGPLGAQQTERLLQELTGQDLEQWLHATFFGNHVSQFKKRPVAWHLASTPQKGGKQSGGKGKRERGGGSRSVPAFECLLYYHACSGDALARIRTQYVEPLLQGLRGQVDSHALFEGDAATSFAQDRIRELEAFVAQLKNIEESGFVCNELQQICREELLDRWSGDGYDKPADHAALQRREEAWQVDINDGVRVNIAPLQLAGVLAKDVLDNKDAKKALGDRVRWRADERRWVREGKLPRCGWLDEQVPANPLWEEQERKRQQAEAQKQGLWQSDDATSTRQKGVRQ